MEERRAARIGTVNGLALLVGGTAFAAVAGDARSAWATSLLGLLTLGLAHALLDEIRRQARRSAGYWAPHDTANTVLLASWSVFALIGTAVATAPVRAVGLFLFLGYAVSCAYFVIERRRTVISIGERVSEDHPPVGPSTL